MSDADPIEQQRTRAREAVNRWREYAQRVQAAAAPVVCVDGVPIPDGMQLVYDQCVCCGVRAQLVPVIWDEYGRALWHGQPMELPVGAQVTANGVHVLTVSVVI